MDRERDKWIRLAGREAIGELDRMVARERWERRLKWVRNFFFWGSVLYVLGVLMWGMEWTLGR